MEQQQIKACIDAMAACDLAEMEFSQEGWTLRLVRRTNDAALTAAPLIHERVEANDLRRRLHRTAHAALRNAARHRHLPTFEMRLAAARTVMARARLDALVSLA